MKTLNFLTKLASWREELSARIRPVGVSYPGSESFAVPTERRARDDREMSERRTATQSGARVAREWLKDKMGKCVNCAKSVMQIFKLTKLTEQIFAESLKSLILIFAESAKSAKSAKPIYATFATSASANFVGKEFNESTVMYRVKSRIPSYLYRYSLDSHLSRLCLASLICLCMLTVGVGNVRGANQTYTLVSNVSTLTNSDKILIVAYDGSNYYALKNNQVTSNSNLACTQVTITGGNTITADLETDYTWYPEYKDNATISGNSYRRYYFKSTKGTWYLWNSGNTGSQITTKHATDAYNIWVVGYKAVNSSSQGCYGLWNQQTSRMLSVYNSTTRTFRAYQSGSFNNINGHDISIYKLGAACDKNITLTYDGDADTHGCTFVLKAGSSSGSTISEGGTTANCGSGTTTVAVVTTPASHYHVASVTATNKTGEISDQGSGVYHISYTQGSNISSTVTVTFEADPTYTVTWVAGSNPSFSTQTNYAGTALTDPGEPSPASYCPGGKVFVGWTATPIVGEGAEPADLFTSVSGMSIPVGGTTYYAVFATQGGSGSVTKSDELTYTSFFAACSSSGSNTSGSYTNFSSKSGSESDAVYAGNLYKHGNGPSNCKDYIQMRTSSNSGIITTTSGGKAKKVTVDWNSGTANAKVVNIYGKNTAYSAISDLFNIATDGDLLGTITKGTSTELTITEDYEFIGIRSSDGAIYFDAISIDWQASGGYTYTDYATTCCTDWSTPTVTYSSSLAINASEGVTIGSGTVHGAVTYESSDEDVLTVEADGTIHAVGAGTAHIIATWAGDATYCEKSANSNDVTVSGIQVTGTTPVNFGQVYQGASIGTKTIYVTGLGLTNAITPSLPAGSPFSFSPASLAKDCSGATLTISASTAALGTYSHTLTLTSGAFSATVTIKMEVIAKPTATFTDALHELTTDKNGASLNSFNLEAAQGTPVVFPTLASQTKSAGTCEGEYYIFVGWTEGDNNTDPEDHLVTSYTLANGDTKNYYAVWADALGSATYMKLTSDDFKTSPTKYVLGGEDNGTKYFLYTYSSTDADLSWGECSSSEAPLQFTLSGEAGTLVAQDASGNYLAESSAKKKFRMSSTSATVQLQDDGTIETESFYLRYNHNSGSGGLRYYESESSEPAYFYEVSAGGTVHYRTSCCANKVDAPVVTATTVTSTSITLTWPSDAKATGWQIEWNGAGGWVTPSGSCTHTVSGLTPNTTYTWRVRATYEDPVCGADVRSGSTTTNQVYHVTYAKGSGTGTCTATGSTTDETGYEAGATVTLQENGFTLAGHTFAGWTEDDEDITISSNQFTIPDHDVVITASWTAKVDKYFDRMHDQTDASHGGVIETSGTNEGKYYIPKEGCNYSIPTAVDSNTGDACQTSHYKLQGWIAASHMKGYPNNMTGEIKPGEETYIFPPTGTKTATGATYYAIWAEVTE